MGITAEGRKLHFLVSTAMFDRLLAAAARHDMGLSAWIREAIREKLDREASDDVSS